MFENLTVITICYNNPEEVYDTYDSIRGCFDQGIVNLIINGGNKFDESKTPRSTIINGKDTGIYNALNIALTLVKTDYLIFIHSGDKLISRNSLSLLFNRAQKEGLDVIFGSTLVVGPNYFRRHSSFFWKPWMLKFYAQPPHLSAIYSTELAKNRSFNESLQIVSDFYWFKDLFTSRISFETTDIYLVHQIPNGKSSNFLQVTKEFAQIDGGIRAFFLLPFRLMLKLYLSIK